MDVAEAIVKEVATESPNVTPVTLFKFVPVIVTVAPVIAPEGVKEVIVGAG